MHWKHISSPFYVCHWKSLFQLKKKLIFFLKYITEGHRSPKVLGKYYSYSTCVFAHGYLRASTSETHAQVSETARTGAAAGHSGESGRERRHALRGPHPSLHHSPEEGHQSPKVLGKYYSYSTGVFAHGYLRASTSETHAQVSETARTGAAAGHSGESGRERRHAPLRGLFLRGPHPSLHHSPEEGHQSPKVLGKYYSYSTGVFAHGYLRASTSETHTQVSETARTGAAAGHSGESGRERRHAPFGGLSPCGNHTPPYILFHGVTHVVIVACNYPLSAYMNCNSSLWKREL